jgi:RNA-directed DNA polymerase
MYAKLHLTVNEAKSAVASAFGRKFLGFSFWVAPKGEIKCAVAAKPMATYKQRIRQLTRRSGGRSMAEVVQNVCAPMCWVGKPTSGYRKRRSVWRDAGRMDAAPVAGDPAQALEAWARRCTGN